MATQHLAIANRTQSCRFTARRFFCAVGCSMGRPLLKQMSAKPPNGSSPPKLGGVARRRFISRAGVVPEENHLVGAPTNEASRHLLMGAATPPNLERGASIRRLRDIWDHSNFTNATVSPDEIRSDRLPPAGGSLKR